MQTAYCAEEEETRQPKESDTLIKEAGTQKHMH